MVTSINATTDLKSAEAFGAIPVKTDGDSRVLVRDIARVEMGAAIFAAMVSGKMRANRLGTSSPNVA